MGTQAICAFCDDKEPDENLINHTNNFAYKGKSHKFHDEDLVQDDSPLSFRFSSSGIDYSKIISDFGIIRWSNNSVFKGYFKNNIPNGWGIYYHHTNGTFQGEYYNDQPNGFGIFTHNNDSTYMGYWKNERQDGIGEEKWPEGMEYVGEFSMGKKNGLGKYIFPNGNVYYGEWEQNLMNGFGIYLFEHCRIYIGEWLNGLKDGYGEIYGQNNNYFFGYFRNNSQNGFFLFYNDKTGKIIVGYNTNGKVDGIAKYFLPESEGRILILSNGNKIKEIKNLEDLEKSQDDNDIKYKRQLNNYYYMNREEIEEILKQKIKSENYNELMELLKSK
jgi:hypothetical protein